MRSSSHFHVLVCCRFGIRVFASLFVRGFLTFSHGFTFNNYSQSSKQWLILLAPLLFLEIGFAQESFFLNREPCRQVTGVEATIEKWQQEANIEMAMLRSALPRATTTGFLVNTQTTCRSHGSGIPHSTVNFAAAKLSRSEFAKPTERDELRHTFIRRTRETIRSQMQINLNEVKALENCAKLATTERIGFMELDERLKRPELQNDGNCAFYLQYVRLLLGRLTAFRVSLNALQGSVGSKSAPLTAPGSFLSKLGPITFNPFWSEKPSWYTPYNPKVESRYLVSFYNEIHSTNPLLKVNRDVTQSIGIPVDPMDLALGLVSITPEIAFFTSSPTSHAEIGAVLRKKIKGIERALYQVDQDLSVGDLLYARPAVEQVLLDVANSKNKLERQQIVQYCALAEKLSRDYKSSQNQRLALWAAVGIGSGFLALIPGVGPALAYFGGMMAGGAVTLDSLMDNRDRAKNRSLLCEGQIMALDFVVDPSSVNGIDSGSLCAMKLVNSSAESAERALVTLPFLGASTYGVARNTLVKLTEEFRRIK